MLWVCELLSEAMHIMNRGGLMQTMKNSLYILHAFPHRIDRYTRHTTYLLIVVVCYLHALGLRDLIFASRLLHSAPALLLQLPLRQPSVAVVAVEEEQVVVVEEEADQPMHWPVTHWHRTGAIRCRHPHGDSLYPDLVGNSIDSPAAD